MKEKKKQTREWDTGHKELIAAININGFSEEHY